MDDSPDVTSAEASSDCKSPDSTVNVAESNAADTSQAAASSPTVVAEATTTTVETDDVAALRDTTPPVETPPPPTSAEPPAIPPALPPPAVTDSSSNSSTSMFSFDTFAKSNSIQLTVVQLLQLDRCAIDSYIKTYLKAIDEAGVIDETTTFLRAVQQNDANGRQYAILSEAVARHILYSYCDVMYVLNPNVVGAFVGVPPMQDFARLIAANYLVSVELAPSSVSASTVQPGLAAEPPPAIVRTALQKSDPLTSVLQRMRELNPHVFAAHVTADRPAGVCVNAEMCMLLDLLSLNEADRNEYILQCAVGQKLLCVDELTQTLIVNPLLHSACLIDLNWPVVHEQANAIIEDVAAKIAPPAPAAAIAGQPSAKPDKTVTAKVNAVEVKVAKKALPVIEPITKLSKNAKKKPVEDVKQKTKPSKTKPSSSTIEHDLMDATKCMQRLMVEYNHTRPDCDAASNHSTSHTANRKRGSRGSSAGHGSSAAQYRNTIMFELQRIQQQVTGNCDQLGKLTEPDEYEQFVIAFDRTVKKIQKRLNAVQIAASAVPVVPVLPVPKPKQAKQQVTNQPPTPKKTGDKVPATYSDHLNNLAEFVTNTYKYRIAPFAETKAPANQFDDERNIAIVDKFVGKLLDAKLGRLIEGDIRINAYNLMQGYVTAPDCTEDTLVESVLLRQCAMHSDLVRVFVFNPTARSKERTNPLGFVVRVLERRNDRVVLGHATPNKNRNYCMLQSTNKRVPALRIAKTTALPEMSDQLLYMARIVGWQPDGTPLGEIVRVIGDRNVLATNNEAILLYNKLEVPSFTASIVDELPSDTFAIPRAEYETRTDLTGECIFTIDPETARDLDDALSVRTLPNGNHEVGVHISDVTYFIVENSELDRMVREQATSIYLVDNVYHMLPRSLCMTCSLLPGQDKLAFSVFWEMTDAGDVISTRFERTIIRSCAQLSYEHAQLMLDEPERNWAPNELPAIAGGFSAQQLAERVGKLQRLARPLRERRFARHCLKIDQPKIVFKLDETSGEPISFERYRQIDSNWLIEEFMLLANQSVAQRIFDAYPERSLLRNHMPPKPLGVEALATKLRQFDFRIDVSTPQNISQSMYRLMNNASIPANVMAVLTEWMTRPMNRAHYICSTPGVDLSHFALSIPIYTHFTSPIRRYPDVLVHRLLAAALRLGAEPTLVTDELERIAMRCNEQKYNAKCAGEASTELYFAHYVRRCKALQMSAVVTEVVSVDMFEIMLLDTGAKLKVVIGKHKPAVRFTVANKKPLSGVLHFEAERGAVGSANKLRVEVFSELLVSVTVTDANVLKATVLPQ